MIHVMQNRVRIFTHILLGIMLSVVAGHAEGVYVLSTSLTKPNVIEKELSSKVKSGTVKVFARFSDFKAMVEKDKPDVVIAPVLALNELGLQSNLKAQGLVGGKNEQKLLLVSLSPGIDVNTKPDAQIGLLDVAGRKAMRIVLVEAVGQKSRIKLVSKLEDLLPMLTFKNADAILVTEKDYEELKSRTQAQLVATPANGKNMGALAVAMMQDNATANKAVAEIKALGKNELKMLGVESWK